MTVSREAGSGSNDQSFSTSEHKMGWEFLFPVRIRRDSRPRLSAERSSAGFCRTQVLIRRSSPRIAQRNQLPRRIIRRRQRRLGILIHNLQHLAAAHSLDGQGVTFHCQHPIFLFEYLPLRPHTGMGCTFPCLGLHINFSKIPANPLDNDACFRPLRPHGPVILSGGKAGARDRTSSKS